MKAAIDKIHAAISDRINNPNAVPYPDPWWEKEISMLSADLDTTIYFIRQECTDEELFWLGEIIEDLILQTKSKALLQCLRERAKSVKDSKTKEEILRDIEDAASCLSD